MIADMEKMSPQGKLYISSVLLIGSFILIWYVPEIQNQAVGLVLALGLIAGLIKSFKEDNGSSKTSFNLSLFVFSFSFFLLGLPGTLIVILLAHLLEWLKHRYEWYYHFYSITSYVIVAKCAALVNDWISLSLPPHNTTITLGLVISMVVFIFLDHFSERVFNLLINGESITRSRLFKTIPLMIDLTLLYLGVLAAFVWQVNKYAVVLTISPLILIYTTSKIPTLKKRTRLDPKTGLYNSRYFEEALEKEISRSARFNRPLTVAMADMDFMRNINNTYGHLAGDEVLLCVARILNKSFREYDIVARFGGEEFAILLPEVSIQEAYYHFESLRKEIEEYEFQISTSDETVSTTICFGLSELASPDQPIKEIIHNADRALYKAKMTGRNKVSLYFESGVDEVFHTVGNEMLDVGQPQQIAPQNNKPVNTPSDPAYHEIEFLREGSQSTSTKRELQPRKRNYLDLYIGIVAIVSVLLLRLIGGTDFVVDWLGISSFAILAMLTKWFSVDIYVKGTTISTSFVPFVASAILFGPYAVVILAFLMASVKMLKHQRSLTRITFDFSRQVIGGTIVVALTKLIGTSVLDLSLVPQLGLSILAAGTVYTSSAWLQAGAIDLEKGQPVWEVWQERFQWQAPSYLLLGVMVCILTFSYSFSGAIGILIVGAPLFLLRYSQKQYASMAEAAVDKLRSKHEEVIQRSRELDKFNESLLQVLAKVIEYRDPFVYGHSEYVAKYSCRIAEELGMSEEKVEMIYQAALLHDIGKLGIPESVLLKPGILSDEEYDIVQQHSIIGAELLEICPSFHEITSWIRHHHERVDGWGYPNQLIGDEIPIEARIISLADAVDSMASDRPYRNALEPNEILEEIKRNVELQFDPVVTAAFFRIIEREGMSFIRNSASMIPESKLNLQSIDVRV